MNYLLKTIMKNLNFLNSNNNNHKSIRVRTNIGDNFINVNLDQTYESLDILSLKIYQKDIYRLFDADYAIIVGRVNSDNVGIPNCRVSVFVPIDEETISGPTNLDDIKKIEAAALYPYTAVYDKDNNGKIYKIEPINGEEGDIYIGSTTKERLSQRMTAHKGDYSKWLKGKHTKLTSFDIILLERCPSK